MLPENLPAHVTWAMVALAALWLLAPVLKSLAATSWRIVVEMTQKADDKSALRSSPPPCPPAQLPVPPRQ